MAKYEPKYDEAGNLVLHFDDGTTKIAAKARDKRKVIKAYREHDTTEDLYRIFAMKRRRDWEGKPFNEKEDRVLEFAKDVRQRAKGGTALLPFYVGYGSSRWRGIEDVHFPGKKLPEGYGHTGISLKPPTPEQEEAARLNNLSKGVSAIGVNWADNNKEQRRQALQTQLEALAWKRVDPQTGYWEGISNKPRKGAAPLAIPHKGVTRGYGDTYSEVVAPEFKPERQWAHAPLDMKKEASEIANELIETADPEQYNKVLNRALREHGLTPGEIAYITKVRKWGKDIQYAIQQQDPNDKDLMDILQGLLQRRGRKGLVDDWLRQRPSRYASDKRLKFAKGKTHE